VKENQNKLVRRAVLKLGLVTALSPMISSPASAAPASWDVVVIGAGISGLSAASWLHDNDYGVVVVEGRERLGGRVWSDQSLGFPVDLGASWIHEATGNPINALCQKAGIKTVIDPDRWQYRQPDGTALPNNAEAQLGEMVEWLEGITDTGLSQFQAVQQALQQRHLSAQQSALLQEIYHGMSTDFGALPQDVSAAGLRDGGYSGPERLFPGGFIQVAQYLARGLKVRLGETVQAVSWGKNGVEVSTTKGRILARRAVVTLPLGVLQKGKVKFEPALPEPQQKALDSLRMGLLNKVVLTYPKPFWPSEYQHFANLSQDIGVFGEIANLKALFQQSGLLLFVAGQPAWEREKWGNDKLRSEAETILKKLFPGTHQPSNGSVLTRWGSDPFAHGSYSYLPPGVDPGMRRSLAQPAPPLYFAGEATHETMSATVHGAYLSGLRAAKELDDHWP
jgi:monoamine oxidase